MSSYERTRSRVISSTVMPTSYSGTVYYPGNCGGIPLNSQTNLVENKLGSEETESMTDVVSPEYKRQSAEGKILNNSLYHERISHVLTPVVWSEFAYEQRWGCAPARWYYYLKADGNGTKHPTSIGIPGGGALSSLILAAPADDFSDLRDRLVSRAWSNIDVSEILVLATAAEGKKSVQSLVSMFRKVGKILRHLKKMQIRHLRKDLSLKELENWYMEARYSIRPLYYDVTGVVNALNAKLQKSRQTFRSRSTLMDDELVASDELTVACSPQPWVPASFKWKRETRRTARGSAGVLTNIEDLNTLNIWGMDKIASSVWELVPFSFIVDWFVNVGDVIGSFEPTFGLKALASWVTIEDIVTQTGFMSGYSSSVTPYAGRLRTGQVILSGGSFIKTTTIKTRTPDPTRSILPTWSVRLNPYKLLDLAIIIKSLWKGGRVPLSSTLRV